MHLKTLLSNGLRLVTVPMESVKSVTVLVLVGVGSRYETAQISGVSHFLEHLPAKGTARRPSSLAVSSVIDSVGGATNALTSKEYTGFYIKAASEHLELLLDVLSDEVLNPLLRHEDIESERGVIIEEINMYEDQPQARVGEVWEELLYHDSPLAWRISGEKETVGEISREQIVEFRKRNYHAGAMVVGIAGDIKPETRVKGQTAFDLVEKYFGETPKGQENEYVPVDDGQKKPGVSLYYKKTDQAHLCLGVRAYAQGHPDRYVLAVLANILGGNMSSRLFREVREKRGLAYYISAGADEYFDCGSLVAQAGLKLDAVSEAVRVIIGEFEKFRAEVPEEAELRRAKDYFKGRMILRLEDSFNQASMYAVQELLEKKIETPEEVLAKVEEVSAEDVQRVAKDIFVNQGLNLAIVGPFKDGGEFEKLLKL